MAMLVKYKEKSTKKLTKGTIYEVVDKGILNEDDVYVLKGIDGFHSRRMFEVVKEERLCYMAVSNEVPQVGTNIMVYKIKEQNSGDFFIEKHGARISRIKSVKKMSETIYKVETVYSTYIIQVTAF